MYKFCFLSEMLILSALHCPCDYTIIIKLSSTRCSSSSNITTLYYEYKLSDVYLDQYVRKEDRDQGP